MSCVWALVSPYAVGVKLSSGLGFSHPFQIGDLNSGGFQIRCLEDMALIQLSSGLGFSHPFQIGDLNSGGFQIRCLEDMALIQL